MHDQPQLFAKPPWPVYPEAAGLLLQSLHEPALVALQPFLYIPLEQVAQLLHLYVLVVPPQLPLRYSLVPHEALSHTEHVVPSQWRPLLHFQPQLLAKPPWPVYPELAGLPVQSAHAPAAVPVQPFLYLPVAQVTQPLHLYPSLEPLQLPLRYSLVPQVVLEQMLHALLSQ